MSDELIVFLEQATPYIFLDVRYRYSFLYFVSALCPLWLYFLFTAAAVCRALVEWIGGDGKTVLSLVEVFASTEHPGK